MVSKRMLAARKVEAAKYTKVLCCVCSQFFQTPRTCLEVSNWNVCLECLNKESIQIRKLLAKRGITL